MQVSPHPAQAGRDDSLPQPPYVSLDPPPVNLVPVEGRVLGSVHHDAQSWRPTCPSVPGLRSSSSPQAHLTASARFRARAPGPVSGRLCETTAWRRRPRSRFPVAFPPPAFASRSSDAHRGVRPSSRSAYRTPRTRRTRRDYRVPHARATTGLGAPYTPGTAVLLPAEGRARPAPAALRRLVLETLFQAPSQAIRFTRHQRRFSNSPVRSSPRL